MNLVVLAIIVFSIVSIAASANSPKSRHGQPQRRPWQPPAGPPRPVNMPQRRPLPPVWPESTELGPDKEQESSDRAMGREGEWGDEGRPSPREAKRSTPVPPEQPVARMGNTAALVNSPVPVADPIPDLVNSDNPLVQGVIWAEILGRPRAMRPHRGPRG